MKKCWLIVLVLMFAFVLPATAVKGGTYKTINNNSVPLSVQDKKMDIVYNGTTVTEDKLYNASFTLKNADTESTYTTINWFIMYPGKEEWYPVKEHARTVNIPLDIKRMTGKNISIMCDIDNKNGYKSVTKDYSAEMLLSNIQDAPVEFKHEKNANYTELKYFVTIVLFLLAVWSVYRSIKKYGRQK